MYCLYNILGFLLTLFWSSYLKFVGEKGPSTGEKGWSEVSWYGIDQIHWECSRLEVLFGCKVFPQGWHETSWACVLERNMLKSFRIPWHFLLFMFYLDWSLAVVLSEFHWYQTSKFWYCVRHCIVQGITFLFHEQMITDIKYVTSSFHMISVNFCGIISVIFSSQSFFIW